MGKKTGITFPAAQGLIGLAFLLLGLLRLFAPGASIPWAVISTAVSVCACAVAAFFIRRHVLSQKERDAMEEKYQVDAEDERNVHLRERSAYLSGRVTLVALCAFVVAVGLIRPLNVPVFVLALGLLALHCFLPLVVYGVLVRRG